jgi:hypothetical protein
MSKKTSEKYGKMRRSETLAVMRSEDTRIDEIRWQTTNVKDQ